MIINLITDLGTTDHYLAKLKLSILKQVGQATFVDTAHNLAPYDISLAAYHLDALVDASPAGTLHIIAVNSHYHRDSRHLVFAYKDQFFVGPDNGVFYLAFPELKAVPLFEAKSLDAQTHSYYATYAHAAKVIRSGQSLSDHFLLAFEPKEKISIRPGVAMHYIRATVEQVDHYGNVITNLTRTLFEKEVGDRRYEIHYHPGAPITKISKTYGDANVDDVLCLWNENNRLEIAVNMGHAASLLNIKRGDSIQIDLL